MTTCDEILPIIKADFGSLWHCKARGGSIEIITPFSTSTQKFVSVFVTFRDSQMVVSDGGWLEDDADLYTLASTIEDPDFEFFVDHFRRVYKVLVAERPDKKRIFFKKTADTKLLTGAVYDIANFVVATVNATSVPHGEEEGSASQTFRQDANCFFEATFQNLKLGGSIEGVKSHKYSVVIYPTPSTLALVSYVTGSTPRYFGRELSNAICGFQVANRSVSRPYIRSRIALLDNSARGYDPSRLEDDLSLLPEHGASALSWIDRDQLLRLITV
jgi:hypothetical protein